MNGLAKISRLCYCYHEYIELCIRRLKITLKKVTGDLKFLKKA